MQRLLIGFLVAILAAVPCFAQTMIDVVEQGSGAWALADSGDYFHKTDNITDHVWEHWGNVFSVAGV